MRNKIQLSLFLTLLILGAQGNFAYVYASPVNFTYSGVCLGSPTVFTGTVTAAINADTWKWDFGDGNYGYGQTVNYIYPGPNTTPGYTVILEVVDTNGISYYSATQIIVIQPLPIPFFSFDTPNCSNDSIQFTNLSTPSAGHYISQWTWNFDDGSPAETFVSGDDPKLKHVFANDRIFDVTLTVRNSVNSCENTISRAVTVTPPPVANFYSDGICEDQAVKFTDASSANGSVSIVDWNWDFGDPTSGTGQNTSILPNPTHIFAQPGPYIIRLIVANSNNCSDTIEKNIIINSSPAVGFTNTPVCLNQEVTFSPDPLVTNLTSIATWKWDFGDGISSNEASTSHTFWAPADYVVTLKVSDLNGCLNEATQTVKVNPLPVAQFSTYQSYCTGAEVQFNDLSSPSTGYISSWEWDFGDGQKLVTNQSGSNISHVYVLATSYWVTLTIKSSDGCTGTGTNALIINPNPLANFDFTTACVGTPTVFTDLTQLNGAGIIMDWHWDFGDSLSGIPNTSSQQNPLHTFVASGNSNVTLIVNTSNGCTDTITRSESINPPPPVNFNTSSNCQNKEVSFIPDISVMNLATIASWYWDFGNGISTIPNPTHTFISAGLNYVSLTITDTSGCSNTILKQIIISSEPHVDFIFPQPACKGTLIQIDNLSNVPGGYIVKNEWDFGDGNTQVTTTLQSVFHTYSSYKTYIVTLTVTSNDGCEKKLSVPVVILPRPLADFSFSGACLGSPVAFSDLSQPGIGGITSRDWEFGDAGSGSDNFSKSKFPEHTYDTMGAFPVSLIVINSGGCIDTIVKQVLVHGLPVVDFTSSPGCINELTHFTSSVFVNTGAIVSRSWNFGDGHTSSAIDPSNTYATSGSFIVTLTITDTAGCVNTQKHTIIIAESPSSLFEVSALTCAGNPINFTVVPSPSGNTISTYFWEFGDGSNILVSAPATGNISHTYPAGGNFTAVLTVQTVLGCKAKSQRTFTVSPAPLAQFNFENSCQGAAVNFKDISQANSGSIISWSWDFDDPSSVTDNTSGLENPYHVFNSPGTYKVLLKVENSSGCSDTATKSIVINPKPLVDFDWSGNCTGSSTKFTVKTSFTNVAAIASYNWDFGDGTTHNTTQNPSHNYTVTGNHTVTLTIVNTSGCKNSVSHIITISSQPEVVFSSNSSCLGANTQFTDQSFAMNGMPITAWHWDFGVNSAANDTSNQQNPSWIYNTKGVYQVKLTVTSQNGCQNSVTLPSQVFGNPTANFTYTVSPCDKGAVYFQDSSYNIQAPIASYSWEFESNHTSDLQDPVYVYYSSDSCYDVRLIAKDIRGCVDTVVKKACVPAEFNFSFAATNNCLFDSTYFFPLEMGTSTGTLVSFYWNFGDQKSGANNISTKKSPTHYYTQPGKYSVSLSAMDIYNCSKIIYRDITILPLPVSYFTYNEGACDSSVYFNESSFSVGSNINRWTWDYGDGVIQTVEAPDLADVSHQYAVPGTYSVSLTVTNSTGCSTKTTVSEVLVKPCLTAAFELTDTLICQNNTLSFIDKSSSSNPINVWYWDFGDGTHKEYTTYTNRIWHKFESSGTFRVQLILSTNVAGRKVSDTSKMSVIVNPTPLPDFIFGTVCHEQTAVFTNMTSGNGTKIVSYNWAFGEPSSDLQDTSTLKNPSHLYKSPGTYDITLAVKNSIGCIDSIQKSMVIHGLPEANYSYALSCAGNKTSFVDLSIAAVAPLVDWEWTFYNSKGIAGKADIQNPDFVYVDPGEYLVNLKVTDVFGCMDTINQNVTTWSVPSALFSFTENYKELQGQLQFSNESEDATKYYWDFGNGTVSYTGNPIAFYENDGTYDITLITRNDKDCSDTMSIQYKFMVKGLYIPNAFSPDNLKTEVQLLKPVGLNLDQYRFEVYDRWGNLLWWTDKLDPSGRPTEGWDGKYKGNLMQEGVYAWRAFGVFKDGSIWEGVNVGNNDHLPSYKVGTASMIR